jgi:hypothetical protein
MKANFVDLRLRNGLDTSKHYTQQKHVTGVGIGTYTRYGAPFVEEGLKAGVPEDAGPGDGRSLGPRPDLQE